MQGKKFWQTVCLFFLVVSPLFFSASPVFAADIRHGEDILIPATETDLEDLYLFGGKIKVDAPVTNDLVVAGGRQVDLNETVTGNVLASGGNLNLRGKFDNTVRIAGGNIVIDGPITRDLLITGGSVTVTKNASIGGDVLFAGGDLDIQSPVQGKILLAGGQVTINNTVGGDVQGEIGKLVLGPQAKIDGNLSYSSSEKATIMPGALVAGKQTFTPSKNEDQIGKKFFHATLYKLAADIIVSVLFIAFFGRFLLSMLTQMNKKPLPNGAIGFAVFALLPILALCLLILIWPGVATLLLYALVILIALFVTKIFIGWKIMRWFTKRKQKEYTLDWKAGVIGPLVVFILLFIPIFGWLILAIFFFIALGTLARQMMSVVASQKLKK